MWGHCPSPLLYGLKVQSISILFIITLSLSMSYINLISSSRGLMLNFCMFCTLIKSAHKYIDLFHFHWKKQFLQNQSNLWNHVNCCQHFTEEKNWKKKSYCWTFPCQHIYKQIASTSCCIMIFHLFLVLLLFKKQKQMFLFTHSAVKKLSGQIKIFSLKNLRKQK